MSAEAVTAITLLESEVNQLTVDLPDGATQNALAEPGLFSEL